MRRGLAMLKKKVIVQMGSSSSSRKGSSFPMVTKTQKKRIHKILAQRIKVKLN